MVKVTLKGEKKVVRTVKGIVTSKVSPKAKKAKVYIKSGNISYRVN